MNNLNSVLLEGKITGAPVNTHDDDGTSRTVFHVESTRTERLDPAPTPATTSVFIVTHKHLADVCFEYLRPGRGVRIVGRLAQAQDASLYLEAEYVEFKSERRTA